MVVIRHVGIESDAVPTRAAVFHGRVATNAAIKRKFGETLKSKNTVAQVNELLAKLIAYNLTVVIHEMHENGVEPDFLNLKSKTCTQSQVSEGV